MSWDGLLLVNKPPGCTSHTIVQKIKKRLHVDKAGHLGTLDPLATGVFPVCVGKATRMATFYMGADKCYLTAVRFGYFTTTDDREGNQTSPVRKPDFTREQLETMLQEFQGDYRQKAPTFSAKKVGGQKAYEMARRGKPLDLPENTVRIHEIKLIHFEQDVATIFIHCSSGTYVRSIARDLGMRFDCGAHVHELTRTKFNGFTVQECCDPDGPPGDLMASFVPMEKLLEQFPKAALDETQSARILNGSIIRLEESVTEPWVRLFAEDGRLLAMGQVLSDQSIQPKIVFH
jgi:tRNA pseudouridine55 synthase